MKSYKILFLFFALFCLSACSDFLDKQPDDQLTLDMIFSDKVRTEDWLAGIYSSIPDPYWGALRTEEFDPLSDDMAPSPRWEQFGWDVIGKQTGNWNPTTGWPANYWTELPKRIRSAYIFLDNVKANPAQKVTDADVENMKNEARFLIAYYYSQMASVYGAIPFHPGLTSSNASTDSLMLGQTPYDVVIDWCDKQLKDLSTKLPAKYDDNNKFGRATAVMCLAVRARMLLFAASPLVNGNSDYQGFVNNKGVPLFNTAYDKNKWVKAANACKELIDLAETNGHKLYYEYNDDGTVDPFLSYQNMMFKKASDGNNEILFARPSCQEVLYDQHPTPRGCGGNGGLGVTQSLVDAFFMENGLPITDPNSGYSEKGFSAQDEVRNTKWSEVAPSGSSATLPGVITRKGTFNMYCNREPRFYISVLYNGAWFRQEGRETHFYFGDWDGGPTHDAPAAGYLVRKKRHPDSNVRNGIYPYRPGILYRLGEAYLNYAEALNEVDPSNPDILKYVNRIRERAGIPDLPSGLLGNQNELRAAIRRERRVELNCEGIRYDDIRRWKIGEQTLDGDFWGMNFQGTDHDDNSSNPNAYFVRKVYQTRKFSKKNYWFPVPQSEIDKNPNLVQNPYWK